MVTAASLQLQQRRQEQQQRKDQRFRSGCGWLH
jgi:hypothetical protein